MGKTTIPIPTILDWSDDPYNPIGNEYIIMDHVKGVQLYRKWPTMSTKQKIKCISALFMTIKQIASLKFPAYGSLYAADSNLHLGSTLPVAPGLCVGSSCSTRYWDCDVGESKYYTSIQPNRGPWFDFMAYCDGLIDTGRSRFPPGDMTLSDRSYFQGSYDRNVRMLEYTTKVINELAVDPRIRRTAPPMLLHPDLHKRNIFVLDDDPTIVTDIIDWQSSTIKPVLEYAKETPDLAACDYQLWLEEQPVDEVGEVCKKTYEECLRTLVPTLADARALDEELVRPFQYCHQTWRHGAVAIRRELTFLSHRWQGLGLPNACPYPLPTPEEIASFEKEDEEFMAAFEIRAMARYHLNTDFDGWVPAEVFAKTKAESLKMYDVVRLAVKKAETADEKGKSERLTRQIWPYDLP